VRSIVSLIQTSPETVADDYARAIDLAEISLTDDRPKPLLVARLPEKLLPGFFTPPWQLESVGKYLLENSPEGKPVVLPVSGQGVHKKESPARSSGWELAMRNSNLELAPVAMREPKLVRPQVPLPALGAVLPRGFEAPPILNEAVGLLLPTAVLHPRWQFAGAVALLTSLLAGNFQSRKTIPFEEVIAEALSLALHTTDSLSVVMDGTVWGAFGAGGKAVPLARNVVLAGNDPVAVDAVAASLAGLQPQRIPWLRLCADRGHGTCDLEKITVVGQKELLDLDFRFPEDTFAAPGFPAGGWSGDLADGASGTILSWPGRVLGTLSRKDSQDEFETTAWGRFLSVYCSGELE